MATFFSRQTQFQLIGGLTLASIATFKEHPQKWSDFDNLGVYGKPLKR